MAPERAWYYLDPSTGVVHTGWLKDGDHWYYLTRSGAMVTGVRWIFVQPKACAPSAP